jgi:hypothetical protein
MQNPADMFIVEEFVRARQAKRGAADDDPACICAGLQGLNRHEPAAALYELGKQLAEFAVICRGRGICRQGAWDRRGFFGLPYWGRNRGFVCSRGSNPGGQGFFPADSVARRVQSAQGLIERNLATDLGVIAEQ